MTDLEKYLNNIADDIYELYLKTDSYTAIRDWLEVDVLDIDFIITHRGGYKGAEVTLTVGGPNVYLNTVYARLDGYWGTEKKTRYLLNPVVDVIDDILSEYWRAIR